MKFFTKNKVFILIAIIVIVLFGVLGYVIFHKKFNTNLQESATNTTSQEVSNLVINSQTNSKKENSNSEVKSSVLKTTTTSSLQNNFSIEISDLSGKVINDGDVLVVPIVSVESSAPVIDCATVKESYIGIHNNCTLKQAEAQIAYLQLSLDQQIKSGLLQNTSARLTIVLLKNGIPTDTTGINGDIMVKITNSNPIVFNDRIEYLRLESKYSYDKNGTRITTKYLSLGLNYKPNNPVAGIYTATISLPALDITRNINVEVLVN